MRIKPIVTTCLIGSLITTSLQAENLMDIYNLAQKNDPIFLASGALLDANLEDTNQSFSALLPTVTGSITNSYSKTSSGTTDVLTSKIESVGSTLGLSLYQLIYDYSTWVSYDQAKKSAEQARVQYKVNEQDLIIRVAETYLDILGAKDKLEFAVAEQKAIKQELEQTKQRYEVGLIAITDVHEAQARFDQSEADRIIAQNTLDNAHEALREITGRYHNNLDILNTDIPLISPEPARIDDWVQVARESNLNVISSNMTVYLAQQDIKRNFGGHYPSVSLSASYSDTTTDLSWVDVNSESYGLSGSINVNIPIYSGGLTNSRVEESEALYKKATYDLESAMRSTIRTARSAYLGVNASISGIKALEQSVVSQQSALEATQAGFEVGTRTIVDVLLSTRTLYSARSSLSSARYNYILAVLKLKQAAGILSSFDLQEINKWMVSGS
ncbi:MAG: TolC family outer membrane protein [Gammaproteobacteria bacterium]|nr:TolC family outer membrane protein [Gammaproteobacteria bacterium]